MQSNQQIDVNEIYITHGKRGRCVDLDNSSPPYFFFAPLLARTRARPIKRIAAQAMIRLTTVTVIMGMFTEDSWKRMSSYGLELSYSSREMAFENGHI